MFTGGSENSNPVVTTSLKIRVYSLDDRQPQNCAHAWFRVLCWATRLENARENIKSDLELKAEEVLKLVPKAVEAALDALA